MTSLLSRLSLVGSIMSVVQQWADSRSKDPSTKVGAGIYDPANGGLYLGYNGFPPGIEDDEEVWNRKETLRTHESPAKPQWQWSKYDLVVHAEVNAVRKALTAGVDMTKAIMVCTHLPCERCMKDVVCTHGLKTIYYNSADYASCSDKTKAFAGYCVNTLGIFMEQIK